MAKQKLSRPQIMVLGAAGQLGSELVRQLPIESVIPKTHEALDITDFQAVQRTIAALRPEVVINAAAVTNRFLAKSQPDLAWRVNAAAVENLIKSCAFYSGSLIHISTGDVFGMDQKPTPYSETDIVGPTDPLSVSKVAGEHAVLGVAQVALPSQIASGFRWWVIRSSSIYDHPGGSVNSVVNTLLMRGLASRTPIPVPGDVVVSPTYAPHLAKAISWLATNHKDVPCGVYHIANTGQGSLYDVASEIHIRMRQQMMFAQTTRDRYASSMNLEPAMIPKNTSLSTERWDSVCPDAMPDWRQAIDEYVYSFKKANG